MYWFRQQRHNLLHLSLALWLLGVVVAAYQGCLLQTEHDPSAPHSALTDSLQQDEHALHASGCLQHAAEATTAISPTPHSPSLDFGQALILVLLPALAGLYPAHASTFLALQRPAPPRPPARLLFVRRND